MYSDLMGASCVYSQSQKSTVLSLTQDTIFGKGILSFTFPICNSELLPVVPVPDNPLVNIAFALGKEAFLKG